MSRPDLCVMAVAPPTKSIDAEDAEARLTLFPSTDLDKLATQIEKFEADESVPSTGTGSRREGEKFEGLVKRFWDALRVHLECGDVTSEVVEQMVPRRGLCTWSRLSVGSRAVYVPSLATGPPGNAPDGWLDTSFEVGALVASFPGTGEAIRRYAPDQGRYKSQCYPKMFEKKTTVFDETILFEEDCILKEKMLLEYKTAKSSKGKSLDGNAHERLSFQIMQYLEVATRFPHCSLCVLANGAFVKYENKYHVNFHIQADRLNVFRWFSMFFACTRREYAALVERIVKWLHPHES